MVLRPNVNNAKRVVSNAENVAPFTSKPPVRELHSSIAAAARHRRTRKVEAAVLDAAARRKRLLKTKKAPIVKMTVSSFVPDVEMADGETARPTISTKTLALPRQLPRSERSGEVDLELFKTVAPEVFEDNSDMDFVRDCLAGVGPDLLPVLAQAKLDLEKNKAPREVSATVQNPQHALPTHVMAVHGPVKAGKKVDVACYPFHSVILAANCASMPKLPPPASIPEDINADNSSSPVSMQLPVAWLELPFPAHFPVLLRYLYTKNAAALFGPQFLPMALPAALFARPDDAAGIRAFAGELARTFSTQHLVGRSKPVFELWADMCRLGVVDDGMWEAVGCLWEIVITAIAISSGNLERLGTPDESAPESQESTL